MNSKAWSLLSCLLLAGTPAHSEVVANAKMEAIHREEIVRAYTGRLKQWPTGELVAVLVLPRDHPATRTFAFEVMGITPSAFEDLYLAQLSSQQRTPIVLVDTESQVFRKVAMTIGAVGYMNNTLLINDGNGYVKIIRLR